MNKKTHQKGFTLMEAVVATSVFAFAVSAMMGVYMAVNQLNGKSRAQRAVTQNARFIMDYLAKEVRNGSIFYAGYPGGTVNSTLAITNQTGETEYFYLQGSDLKLEKSGAVTNLNSSSALVTKASFLVSPATTPFTPAKTVNEQPYVTVILELTSNYGNRVGQTAKINLQSTFTVRQYPSRQ